MSDELAALEKAVLAQAPPGAAVVGASISPDGKHAAALTVLPTAGSYPMDCLFDRVADRWEEAGGGSGGGIAWTTLEDVGDLGVLRFGGKAPEGAAAAWIAYEGGEHRAPVRHRHFLFAAWNTASGEQPHLLRFE